MTRLTGEELSRVLTAHEAGGLQRGGARNAPAYPGCLNQVAFLMPSGLGVAGKPTAWFDYTYRDSWTTDEFLAALEAQGLT